MKIRNGFVSNSSSSSFIVIMKNGQKMTKETLLETFDVKKTSPLYGFSNDLSKWIMNNVKEMDIKGIYENYVGHLDTNLSIEEIIEEIVEDSGINKEKLKKVANKEIRYYEGSASSESGDALEYYLYEGGLNIETDSIKIESGDN